MAFVREWPRRAGAACWPRGARRAASACPPERPGAARSQIAAGATIPATGSMAVRLATLKTRADFLRVAAAAHSAGRPGLILQTAPQPAPRPSAGRRAGRLYRQPQGRQCRGPQPGQAAAARCGGRGHRREHGRPGTDYVLIARTGTGERPYADLSPISKARCVRWRRAGRARLGQPAERVEMTTVATRRRAAAACGDPRLSAAGVAAAAAVVPLLAELLALCRRGDRTARRLARAAGWRCGGCCRCHPWGGSGYDPVPP